MYTDGAAIARGERLEIAQRLRGFQHAEGVLLARYGQVVVVIGSDLYEHTCIRTALVELSRGVQEAWTIAGRRRDFQPVTKVRAQLLQELVVRRRLVYVGQQS